MSFNGDLYPTAGADVVMTTSGDMVKYESGARKRLGIGSANQILQVKSSLPSWETLSTAGSILTTQGDVLIEGAAGLERLGQSTDGFVLTTKGASANPVWASAGGGITATAVTDENFSGVYTGASQALGANALIFGTSLPWGMSAYKFVRCTALECKIGSVTSGDFQLTLWARNSATGKMAILAWTHEISQSHFGINTIAKLETLGSAILPPTLPTNTIIWIGVHTDDSAATFFNRGGTGVGAALTYDASGQYYVSTDTSEANSYSNPELKFYGVGYS